MVNVLARIKQTGKNFEIIVDQDQALKFKSGEESFIEAEGDKIFTDSKKGQIPSQGDLKEAFGTEDTQTIIQTSIQTFFKFSFPFFPLF